MPHQIFALALTTAISDVLAQTQRPGLTSSELLSVLEQVKIFELEPGPNKRTSLGSTLHNAQVRRGRGDTLVAFVNAAMNPARYVHDHERWSTLRDELDQALIFYASRINDAGQWTRGSQRATTLSEAAELAGTLQTELRRRGCHAELLNYCREEPVAKSLFHAVSEAAKSIPDRIRSMTGTPLDGAELYDEVLGSNTRPPQLVINAFATPSEQSEHKGFKNLLLGIHGHYRNPRAHMTRLGADESALDLYDAFSLFSYIHRRLDGASKR